MGNFKVLMVDDSPTVLTFEKMMLRAEGYELHTAPNGKEGLARAHELKPDLILMDVVMPEMDGVECCRQIKSSEETRHIPIIMVTTKGNQSMVTAAFAAGCNDFITKPIDKLELLKKIKSHLAPSGAPTLRAAK